MEPFLFVLRAIAIVIGLFWLAVGLFVARGSETPRARRTGLIVCAFGVLAAFGMLLYSFWFESA